MWRLFNSHRKSKAGEFHIILDGYQRFECDREYAETGVREGWLRRNGYYGVDNGIVWTYITEKDWYYIATVESEIPPK